MHPAHIPVVLLRSRRACDEDAFFLRGEALHYDAARDYPGQIAYTALIHLGQRFFCTAPACTPPAP